MRLSAPDSHLVSRLVPSPNHGERRVPSPPDMILLHYTGMPDAGEALRRLCDRGSGVSAHYIVFENGDIAQCVAEARRAWHAGQAFWGGETDINSRAIGIEIANPGHDWGYREFAPSQIAALAALCRDIGERRRIAPQRVLAHSDVAPARKKDPGEKFPWRALHRAGVGHWVAPRAVQGGDGLGLGDSGPAVEELHRDLAAYGYGVPPGNRFEEMTEQTVTAFQRHFRPARVDGVADDSTIATLRDLLAARLAIAGGAKA
jgi:N-acetylmuramoyl-L-alanine amidase